jgi:hypothetical protein
VDQSAGISTKSDKLTALAGCPHGIMVSTKVSINSNEILLLLFMDSLPSLSNDTIWLDDFLSIFHQFHCITLLIFVKPIFPVTIQTANFQSCS